jgi:hypothetical protein
MMIEANQTRLEKIVAHFGAGIVTLMVAMAMLALAPVSVAAQQKSTIAGDYAGTLGPLHIKLHLKVDAAGTVKGTLDSPDRGAIGIRCANFSVDGQTLSFTVPAVAGKWKGTVAADGTLNGTWDQGSAFPLNFAPETTTMTAKISRTGETL